MSFMKKDIRRAMRKGGSNGFSKGRLAKEMRLRPYQKQEFEKVLAAMVEQGEATLRSGRYVLLAGTAPRIKAEIVKITPTFGFAHVEGAAEDIFIGGRNLLGALPGDVVLLTMRKDRSGRSEGVVERILEEHDYRFTGVIQRNNGFLDVMPDRGSRMAFGLMRGESKRVKEGDKVLAELVRGGDSHFDHKAAILMNFGNAEEAKRCCQAVIAGAGVPVEFPEEVEEAARELQRRGIHEKELQVRTDLRDELIFTIDSADSKDLDDAISLKRTAQGYELGVHIADVSYYVTPGSPIDVEAYERGTSVYYADSVIPMLPTALSNGICSLNPGEDRLAFSAIMQLDPRGNLVDYRFQKSVIRSRVKGVYKEINALFDGTADAALAQKYAELRPTLTEMDALLDVLIRKRQEKGGLDLESTESKILIGPDGRAVDVVARESGRSESMIEEFMLLANEAAASFAEAHELPFVYRVHDKPSPEKLDSLIEVLEAVGMSTQELSKGATPKVLYGILQASKETPYSKLINSSVLRSMAKAIYSHENIGHFGLVLQNYAHFTSPIRRYPDLLIHRIMSAYLTGMKRENIEKRFRGFVGSAADQCSAREVRAMNVERDCEDCYKAEYMQQFIGQRMQGILSHIAPHGLYVELPNTVEGFVRHDQLPDGEYDKENKLFLKNLTTGAVYRIGDTVEVLVTGVDVSSGHVDFSLRTQQ